MDTLDIERYWDDKDPEYKKGMVLTGYTKVNIGLIKYICQQTTPQAAMTYILLLSHRNSKTHECFPTIKLLARELSVSETTINKSIKLLKALKVIIVISGNTERANRYIFPYDDTYSKEKETQIRNELKNNVLR